MSQRITSLREYKNFLTGKANAMRKINGQALKLYDDVSKDLSLPKVGDARNAYFGHIANHCNNVVLILLTVADCFSNQAWLMNRVQSGSTSDISILIEELDRFIRKTAFLGTWSYTENALRRMKTELDGSYAKNRISKLCETLYRVDLAHSKADEFLDLIKLVTYTRNTSHNDFSYYPSSGTTEILKYKEKSFEFIVGHTLSFFNWDFIQERSSDLLELYNQTVRTPRVAAIKHIASH